MKKINTVGVVGAGTMGAAITTKDALLGLTSIGKRVEYTGE